MERIRFIVCCILGAILFILMGAACDAAPPAGYKLVFQSNFGTSYWVPSTEWGPTPNYVLGNWWLYQFISHTPYGGDFGYAKFTKSASWWGWGRVYITPFTNGSDPHSPGNPQWWTGMFSSIDTNGNGFSKAAPAYWECQMQLPAGSDVWPSFWLDDINMIQRGNRTENAMEIDIIEAYGSQPGSQYGIDDQEIHTHVWAPGDRAVGGQWTSVWHSGLDTGMHVYGCWIEPSLIHFYFDGYEVWNTPSPPEALHPLYTLVDLAMTDRSWARTKGAPWISPTSMQIQYIRCYAPQ